MNASRKSFQLFTVATVVATILASPAFARIAPNSELQDRKMNAPIVFFHELQQDTRAKDVPGATKEAGVGKRYAAANTRYAAVGTREADVSDMKYAAAGTLDAGTIARQYADAGETFGQYADAHRAQQIQS